MKKFICLLTVLGLFMCAAAEVTLVESEYESASRFAAADLNAVTACWCPSDGSAYGITREGRVLRQGSNGVVSEIAALPQDNTYTGICADENGNVYVMKTDADRTAKSAIICLSNEGNRYYALEYAYPGASGALKTDRILFSETEMTGCAFTELLAADGSVRMMSVLGVFWGSLTGWNEFVVIDPAACLAYALPMETYFDVYGSVNQACDELIKKLESGELLSPVGATQSEDGQALILLAGGKAWLMDVITLDLTELTSDGQVGFEGNTAVIYGADGSIQTFDKNVSGADYWNETDFGESNWFEQDWGAAGTLDDWS